MNINFLIRKWMLAALVAVTPVTHAKIITVDHPLGSTRVTSQPERIVVLGMDALDILDFLQIEPIGIVKAPIPDYLIQYDSAKYQSVGTLHDPDFETIYSLKPDLIIASSRSSNAYDELSKIAPTVVLMTDARHFWATTQKAWRMFGVIFKKEHQVEQIIKSTTHRIEKVKLRAQTQEAEALMVMTNGGNVTTFGAGSRYNAIFDEFGFKQLVRNDKVLAHGDLISYEFIAKINPDYLLVMDRDKAIGYDSGEAKQDFYNELIQQTNAGKNNRITELNPQAWYISASGVTATQLMIEDMNNALR